MIRWNRSHFARLRRIAVFLLLALTAFAFAVSALRRNAVYFYSPSLLASAPLNQTIRLGGYISSIQQTAPLSYIFTLQDCFASISISYQGALPDLFVIGQSGVVIGQLHPDGNFTTSQILAKHDENYTTKNLHDTDPTMACKFPQMRND